MYVPSVSTKLNLNVHINMLHFNIKHSFLNELFIRLPLLLLYSSYFMFCLDVKL